IKAYRDLGGVKRLACRDFEDRGQQVRSVVHACSGACVLDHECMKGQMQAGRAKIKRTPCREGTMDATCRSVPLHLGTAVRVLWGCLALGRRDVHAIHLPSKWIFAHGKALVASMVDVDSAANGMVGLSLEITSLRASLDDENLCPTQPLARCKDHQHRSVKGHKQCLVCLCLTSPPWPAAKLTHVHARGADGGHRRLQEGCVGLSPHPSVTPPRSEIRCRV
ncbi:hypothetical protein SVAN01_08477, partial [Stagonosporopsis vannaccii]